MLKKFRLDIVLVCIVFIVMYIMPLCYYISTNDLELNYNTYTFVLNNITIFICCVIHARYKRLFFIFPIVYSILFIPLVFTLHTKIYLLCVLMYLAVGMLGGIVGKWLSNSSEGLKAVKKAVGISSVFAASATFIMNIVDAIFHYYNNDFTSFELYKRLLTGSLNVYICIGLMVLLAIRCLKSKKKKGD